MKNHWKWPLTMLLALIVASSAKAETTLTQTINLVAGWNAVFLEVEPENADPDAVFSGAPVTRVVTFFPNNSPVLFIQDPNEALWEKSGWRRWSPPGTAAAVLNDLYAMQANRAYIVHSTADFTWNVTGTPQFQTRKWQPDAFNLTGFHVDETAPPTFAQFFEGSRAHEDMKIYELINNQWIRITDPWGVNIASGRAYWVYCRSGSNHQGPLAISPPGASGSLEFIDALGELEITIENRSPNPLAFTVEAMPGNAVPLSLVARDLNGEKPVTYSDFTSHSSAPLEAGEKGEVKLAVRRKSIVDDKVSGLLKISDDLGNRFFITIQAEKI